MNHTHRSTHCWLQSPPTAVGLGWKVGTKSATLCNTTNPYLCSSDPLTLTAASQILRWSPKASNKKLLQMQMSQFCWLRQELLQPSQPTTDPPSYHFFSYWSLITTMKTYKLFIMNILSQQKPSILKFSAKQVCLLTLSHTPRHPPYLPWPLVGFPNWHVSGCHFQEQVGWGTWLLTPCYCEKTLRHLWDNYETTLGILSDNYIWDKFQTFTAFRQLLGEHWQLSAFFG